MYSVVSAGRKIQNHPILLLLSHNTANVYERTSSDSELQKKYRIIVYMSSAAREKLIRVTIDGGKHITFEKSKVTVMTHPKSWFYIIHIVL